MEPNSPLDDVKTNPRPDKQGDVVQVDVQRVSERLEQFVWLVSTRFIIADIKERHCGFGGFADDNLGASNLRPWIYGLGSKPLIQARSL